MSTHAGYGGTCTVGGNSAEVLSLSINREAAEHETTPITGTAKTCITGLPKYTLEMEIIHDGANAAWAAIKAGYTGKTNVAIVAEDTDGYGVSGNFKITGFNESISPNELHTDSVTLVSNGTITETTPA